MTIKEQLSEYRSLTVVYAATLAEIKDLEEQKLAISSGFDDAGRVIISPAHYAKYEAIVDRLTELQKQAEAELEDLNAQRKVTLAIIRRLDTAELRAILHLRYINCLKWERIAEITNYSERHVKRVHKRALEALENEQIHYFCPNCGADMREGQNDAM